MRVPDALRTWGYPEVTDVCGAQSIPKARHLRFCSVHPKAYGTPGTHVSNRETWATHPETTVMSLTVYENSHEFIPSLWMFYQPRFKITLVVHDERALMKLAGGRPTRHPETTPSRVTKTARPGARSHR